MLQRLARTCYRRRRLVLVGWLILLIGFSVLGQAAGGATRTEFKLPGAESQKAADSLKTHGFGDRAGIQGQIVFSSAKGITAPAVQRTMEGLFAAVNKEPGVQVVSPYGPGGTRLVARDGRTAYAEINITERSSEQYLALAKRIEADRAKIHPPSDLKIALGSDIFASQEQPASEAIGLLAAVVILLVAFGSLLTMGLPILVALFGIGCGIAIVKLIANVLAVPSFAPQMAAMLGIGVGIDYALFIVTRYRQGLADGLDPEEGVVRALDTSGRAVLFAGITVVIAVLGMFFMGLEFVDSLAVAASSAVLMTMLASLTLLPATLGFVGRNVDRFGLPHRHQGEAGVSNSQRWSRFIQRRPWQAGAVGLVLLVILAVPNLSLRLGFSDAGNRATTDTTRQAYDMLSKGFGPGFNSPLILAAELPHRGADLGVLQKLTGSVNRTKGVAFASPPVPNPNGDAALIVVYPTSSPQDAATDHLVGRLRHTVVPAALRGSDVVVRVGGISAAVADFSAYTGRRLPFFFAGVLALSFLLLLAVFRSVLVPLKAVIVNLLSIGAAFGLLVAVFQYGWGRSLLGIAKEGPIEAWAPLMLFAIVFGLSMDYEVFLLSRIREEYDRTGDNASAVADGLAATARVITAAAAIMVCVFASFVLGHERALKLFGFGLAVAVFLDATVVRLVLVPSTMELLGDLNWWLPRWLDRRLPALHVDAPAHAVRPRPATMSTAATVSATASATPPAPAPAPEAS